MARDYSHVLSFFYGHPWAILPAKLEEITAVLWRRIATGPGHPPAAEFGQPATAETDAGYTLIGSAAVVKVHGTITPRPSLFSDWSGGTSAEGIGRAVDAAAADPKAEAIVLDVDSPGGSVFGMPENTAKVFAARKAKPVTAVANHVAASAAYWFATMADTVAVTPAGQVGSVGVLWAHTDWSKFEEAMGRQTTYVTAGAFKAEGAPEFPLSAEGRDEMQRVVNEYYGQFVAGVAKGRGIRGATVEKDFGQGRMKLAQEAVDSRMADKIATLEQVVGDVNNARTARTRRKVAADLAAAGFPTA